MINYLSIVIKVFILILVSNISFADISKRELARDMIAKSIASYPGKCACPYHIISNGIKCGKKSSYSNPEDYKPLCYLSDINDEMIDLKYDKKLFSINKKKTTKTFSLRVVDGDTIVLNSKKIRLHGIDTPETKQKCLNEKSIEYFCGLQATKELKNIIGKYQVSCIRKGKDRYGRLVSVCFVNGEDINALLVERGWALAYRKYSKDYVHQENQARINNLGLWSGKFTFPWEWRSKNR
jgi:endonuclease YncB( thermonuclease family)